MTTLSLEDLADDCLLEIFKFFDLKTLLNAFLSIKSEIQLRDYQN